MRALRALLLIICTALLASCATGPLYKEMRASTPGLAEDKARLYFYRPEKFIGSGIRPSVVLNGNVVGPSTPGGFFFVDVSPGPYEVTMTSEVERKLTFTVEKKDVRCVRLTVSLGIIVYRVYPELAEKARCDSEIVDLNYITP